MNNKSLFLAVVMGASLAAPALADPVDLNPQPFPPPKGGFGTLADGERFKVSNGQLFLFNGAHAGIAKPGSYKLKNGAIILIEGMGRFSAATMSKFPALGRAELNPQPLPP